ncbi:MAG: hypothetical protein ACRC6M_15680 [Microcystaceae cyanobacterium]
MKSEKWAITLALEPKERLEDRLVRIIKSLVDNDHYIFKAWEVSDLDATGHLGDRLTNQINREESIFLTTEQFLALLKEGQIIELEAKLIQRPSISLRFIVRDGFSVDVLGSNLVIPEQILGDFITLDPELFLWENEVLLETVPSSC